MKNKFLLPALFMTAAFTACTQEELVENNANDTFEVVGAKMLGDGFAADLNYGENTRVGYDEDGKFVGYVKGDKAAIGWTVKKSGKVTNEQTNVTIPELSTNLYANHMLVHDGTQFNSHSNVYEGWHFGYRPYQYMAKPGELTVTVNPDLEGSDLMVDQYDKMPSFSNAAFVTDGQVNDDGMVDVNFPLQFIANAIRPVLNVSETFTGSELLQGIAINKITLNAGENKLFANELKVQPAGLKTILDAEKNVNVIDETYFGEDAAFAPVEFASSVSTTLDREKIGEETYTLGQAQNTVRIFLAPTQDATGIEADANPLSFRIDVDGGYFEINSSDANAENKASIKMMLDMLQGAYTSTSGTKYDLTKLGNKIKTVPLYLTAENFHTDFTIDSYEKWVKCVNMANALKRDDIVFSIVAGKEILFPEGDMLVPDKKVTVNCATPGQSAWLAITGETDWTDGLGTVGGGVGIKVKDGGKLTVDGFVATSGMVIEEGGTLIAEAAANVKFHSNGTVIKNSGRIEVSYGANLTMGTDKAQNGVVAYNVTGTEKIKEIKGLIAESDNTSGKHAHVNTLVIDNIEWDMLATNTVDGDNEIYNPSDEETTGYGVLLKNINFEVKNGGKVFAKADNVQSVNNVLIENGGTIEYVNIAGKLTIDGNATIINESIAGGVDAENGDVTITTGEIKGGLTVISETNSTVTVTGDIEGAVVAANASVTAANIDGTVEAKPATITANSISGNVTVSGESTINNADMAADLTVAEGAEVALNKVNVGGELVNNGTVTLTNEVAANIATLTNNGTLTSNVDLNVATVALNPKSVTTLSSNGEDYDMTIWYTDSYTFKNMTLNGTVKQYGSEELLNALENGGEVTLKGNVELTAPVTVPAGKTATIDLSGYTLTTSATGDAAIIAEGDLTVKNGTISSGTTAIWSKKNLTLENCNVTNSSTLDAAIYAQDGTVKIDGGAFTNTAKDKHTESAYVVGLINTTAELNNVTIDSEQKGALSVHGGKVTINGGSYTGHNWAGLHACDEAIVDYENAVFSGDEAKVLVSGGTTTKATINTIVYDGYEKVSK